MPALDVGQACNHKLVQHHEKCPIYGNPKWAHIDECGPCQVLRDNSSAYEKCRRPVPPLAVD